MQAKAYLIFFVLLTILFDSHDSAGTPMRKLFHDRGSSRHARIDGNLQIR